MASRLLVTNNISEHRTEIDGILPRGIDFDVQRVDYSMQDMRALQQVITDDIDALRSDGIKVNRVMVGLESADPDAEDRRLGDADPGGRSKLDEMALSQAHVW